MIELIIGLIALSMGSLMTLFAVRKQTATLKVRDGQLSKELEAMRREMSNKAQEWSQSLSQRSIQHAEELAKQREEHRNVSAAIDDEWKRKLRDAEEKAFADGQRQAELRQEKIEKAFSVKVRPYVKKIDEGTFFNSKKTIQVGYQYQLYVTGVPCFQPHVIVDNAYEEKKFEEERMKWFIEKAITVAKVAVEAHSGLPISLDSPLTVEG